MSWRMTKEEVDASIARGIPPKILAQYREADRQDAWSFARAMEQLEREEAEDNAVWGLIQAMAAFANAEGDAPENGDGDTEGDKSST